MNFILTFLLSFIFVIHSLLCFGTQQTNVLDATLLESNKSSESSRASPCIIVIFGATGDLTERKLIPAIYNLAYEDYLSEVVVVGLARGENTHKSFRKKMKSAIDQFSRTKPRDLNFWNDFQNRIFYHQLEFEQDEDYDKLREFLSKIDQEYHTKGNRIYYLATPPRYFSTIIAKLKEHQLIYQTDESDDFWSRVMIEKPFGYDFDSAIQLQKQISLFLAESQIYRIDHYLGKEGVQNIFSFRFENGLFEPIWNRHYIDNIQITLAEEIGIGSRAYFWEETGALRDLLQNHLIQLLAIVTMESPIDLSPECIHREKIAALNAIQPLSLLEIEKNAIRGQYGSGIIQGVKVLGYREEKDVPLSSQVETFAAIKFFINNKRWKGVPFYIRGGKRLAKQTTEIVVTFKKNSLSSENISNVLFIRIQPNAGIFLKTLSKVPGFHDRLKSVIFGYQPDIIFNCTSPEAYERMIFDCIKGNDRLFVKAEEQMIAWRLLTPILDYWKMHVPVDFPNYEAGTWGPKAADQMLGRQGHQWQLLDN